MGCLADCSAGLETPIRCAPDVRSTAPRAMEGALRWRPRLSRSCPPSPLSSSSLLPRCWLCLVGYAVQSGSSVCCRGEPFVVCSVCWRVEFFVVLLDGAALSSRGTCRGCMSVLVRRLLPLFDSNSVAEGRLGLTPGGSIAPAHATVAVEFNASRATVGTVGLPWPPWPKWSPPTLSPSHSCTRW